MKGLKLIGIGFLFLFFAGIILGNISKLFALKQQKDSSNSMESMLENANSHMPCCALDGFGYYTMNQVKQEGNNIVWEVILDTTFFYSMRESFMPESMNGGILVEGDRSMAFDLDTLLSNYMSKQSHRLNMLYYYLFARTGKPNPFYEELMKRKYSQIWRIKSPFSSRHYEFAMTYNEMKEIETFCKSQPKNALDLFMSEYIKRQNRLLAFASGNADIEMSMSNEEVSIVLCCVYDKSYSDGGNNPILRLKERPEYVRIALEKDFKFLPLFYDMKSICDKSQKGFLFRFTDWNKTDSLEIKIY